MKREILLVLIPTITTLLGVVLGNYLNYRNSYSLYTKQRVFESQRLTYSKLLSLKNPWTQSLRTHLEAKVLAEFYDVRFKQFTNAEFDLKEGMRQYDRALNLISEISKIQREVFETLGVIETCFELDDELQTAIDSLYNYKVIEINSFTETFPSLEILDITTAAQHKKVEELLKLEYTDKIDVILKLLKSRLVSRPK